MCERRSLAAVGTSWAPPCGRDRPVPHRLLDCKRKILGTFARVLEHVTGGIRASIPLFLRKRWYQSIDPTFLVEKVVSEQRSHFACGKRGSRAVITLCAEKVRSENVCRFEEKLVTEGFCDSAGKVAESGGDRAG